MADRSIDFRHLPTGAIASEQFVRGVAGLGDSAERHFLEIKGPISPTSQEGKAKVVKFILGAANRMPEVAATYLDGYSVMLIGISEGALVGITPIDAVDMVSAIGPYLGEDGPTWDIRWVPVGDGRRILMIIVDPPEAGEPEYVCRRDLQVTGAKGNALDDGAVYVRDDGSTRRAKSPDVRALHRRAASRRAEVVALDLKPTLDGGAYRLPDALDVRDHFVETTTERLLAKLQLRRTGDSDGPVMREGMAIAGVAAQGDALGLAGLRAFGGLLTGFEQIPEDRSVEDYKASIAAWADRVREAWSDGVREVATELLPVGRVSLHNRTDAFIEGVRLCIHIEGLVTASKPSGYSKRPRMSLPRPPRPWGPRKDTSLLMPYGGQPYPYVPPATMPRAMRFENGGSVSLERIIDELRPQDNYVVDEEECVVLTVPALVTAPLRATWSITARGLDGVARGEFDVAVQDSEDLAPAIAQAVELN